MAKGLLVMMEKAVEMFLFYWVFCWCRQIAKTEAEISTDRTLLEKV